MEMRSRVVVALGLFLLVLPRVCRGQVNERIFDITIVKHYLVQEFEFSDMAATASLNGATTALKTYNASSCNPGDVACCMSLAKSGFVGSFGNSTDGEDIVTSDNVARVFAE